MAALKPHATSEEQVAQLGRVRRKPTQIDMFTGELVVKPPKRGNGLHVQLHRSPDEPVRAIGMAHFPGTGPNRKYCQDCAHFGDIEVYRGGRMRKPSSRPGEDAITPLRYEHGACRKAASMLDDVVQKGGIGANRSCKYFEAK